VAQAEEQCLRFVSADTDNADLWMALGRIFEHQGKQREAFTTYGQVLSLEPDRARAFARQGKLFCEFSQFQAAEASCRRALELDEHDALAHAYLGIALSRLGNNDEARRHAEIAEAAGMNMTSVWRQLTQ
jgi:Flp pilus assembly protein TadD